MNAMTHKGYIARVEYDADDRIFVGRLVGVDDIVTFHGQAVEELEAAFRDAVDHYLDVSAKIGRKPQKSYTGNLMLRVTPEIHARAAIAAELAGKSLNQWAAETLDRAASH
ncbi:MAG: type II toxin-antitoxin system HicB family antitoxin [Alphaproteobacteria bacterium]|nr:type II toxin-antitoxin system HicB family antitoxin [Alphaproteobacteria bacterium]